MGFAAMDLEQEADQVSTWPLAKSAGDAFLRHETEFILALDHRFLHKDDDARKHVPARSPDACRG